MPISGERMAAVGGLLLAVFLSTAQAQDDKAEKAAQEFNGIAEAQNAGLYPQAAAKWVNFVKTFPNYPRIDEAHYFLGICHLRTKKFPEAAASFRTVISKYPKSKMCEGAQYNLGMANFQTATAAKNKDQLKAAANDFAQVPAKFANGKYADRALYFQAEALYAAGELKGAVDAYKKLVTAYSKSSLLPDALYALGTTQQELKLPADAAVTFQHFLNNKALEAHSLGNEIRLRLGMTLYDQEKYADAEKLFATAAAVAKFPHADFALLRQAQCRIETAKHREAIGLLKNYLTKFPKSGYRAAALLALGKSHYVVAEYPAVQAPLEEVLNANTDESPEAAYWLAQSFLKLKKPADALRFAEAAAQKYAQSDFGPHLKMARIEALYELPDRRKETPALYADFGKQHPEHELAPWAGYKASLAALQQKDYAAARQHADTFLANPKLAKHKLVAPVLFCGGESHVLPFGDGDKSADLNRAKQLYERLVKEFPEHANTPLATVRIGWCQYQTKQYDAAIQFLNGSLGKLKLPEHKAEALLLVGRSHVAAGRNKEAVTAYDAALQAKPDWERADEVLLAAGENLKQSGDLTGALQRLNRLNSAYQASALRDQALLQLGEIAHEQKKFDEAILRFRELVEKFASSERVPFARYGMSLAHYAKRNDPQALTALNELLAKHKDSDVAAQAFYLRGLCNQRLSQFDAAIKDLQAFLATTPAKEDALAARLQLSVCQVKLKQLAPAVASLTKLINENPEYTGADRLHYERAYALREMKNMAEATDAFRTLATKFPDSSRAGEAWFHVGRFHEEAAGKAELTAEQKAAELQKAADAYAAGVAKAKAETLRETLQYKLGYLLFLQKKYEPSAATLLQQVKDHPNGVLVGSATFFAAESLYRHEDYQQALPLFEQVVAKKVKEHHAEALYRAGAAAGNLKNWPLSQKHYTALIAAFPQFAQLDEARYGLGWALQNQNQLSPARAAYQQIKSTKSQAAAKAKFMLGEISFTEKNYEDAIVDFLFVAANYPFDEWRALSRFEAGRCFVELGNKERAIEQLQIVVKQFPDHTKAEAAAALIAELKK